jgi:hypothetical protein
MIIKTKLYVHSSKESNWDRWDELWENHRPPEAMGSAPLEPGRRFAYAAMELTLDVEVDLATGEVRATHFEGQELPEPVEIT